MRLSVDDARERVVDLCGQRRVAVDSVPLDRALRRVLAVDVATPHALPPFANSAMDGYALRGADLPREGDKRFHMIGVMLAGVDASLRIHENECVRITTGAPLPDGADTVVIKERVRVDGDAIVVPSGDATGANVRPAGEDIAAETVGAQPVQCRRGLARHGVVIVQRVVWRDLTGEDGHQDRRHQQQRRRRPERRRSREAHYA